MIKDEYILFFGGSDWWYHNPSSGIQLLKEMAKEGNSALYINSMPLRMPKPGKSGSWRRYINKLKSYVKFLRKAEENIWVLTPVTIPGFSSTLVKKINRGLLGAQLKYAMTVLRWRKAPVVISSTPASALILPTLKRKSTIYYLCDKFDKFRDISGSSAIEQLDRSMVELSDHLVCVSKAIHKDYLEMKPAEQCSYIPHGTNFDLFNTATNNDLKRPEDLKGIPGPIIGYFGTITESNDKEILDYIASNRPDWSIVLIGQVVSDYSMLEKYDNVYFLGKKLLEELPVYGRYFDVCIMNWIMNEWISYCNPVKAKEYLAMGKPVVSVPIPEVVDTLSDVVSIAATPSEFLEKVEFELQNDSLEKSAARIASVRGDTWHARADEISEIIQAVSRGT